MFFQPVIRRRIKAFARDKLILQAGYVVLAQQRAVRVFLAHGSKGRGGHKKTLHPMFGQNPPESASIRRPHWFAFVKYRCAASEEWSINNIGMSNHPTHIRSCPVHVTCLNAVNRAHAVIQCHGVTTVIPNDALGLACCT